MVQMSPYLITISKLDSDEDIMISGALLDE